MTPSSLPFPKAFLGRLESARTMAYPLFRGFYPRSAIGGAPMEFDGHRPYLPGDDTRWIDWNIYARMAELYVKVFQVEEEVEVALLLDVSPSMNLFGSAKGRLASSAAIALAYLAFLTDHPLTAITYAEKALDIVGPFRHLQAFPLVTGHLLSPTAGKETDLEQSLTPFLLRRQRPVTVIAVTDGFQRRPLERIAATVRALDSHRLLLCLIEDPRDHRPELKGNVSLLDAEGPARRSFLADKSLEKQLHRRIAAYFKNLQSLLLTANSDILHLSTERPFEAGFLEELHRTAAGAAEVRS